MTVKQLSVANAKGRRPYMEDTFVAAYVTGGLLLGVFDGHGGDHTSGLAAANIAQLFDDENKLTFQQNPGVALGVAVRKLASITNDHHCGSTLSLVYVPDKGDEIFTAVLGDSPICVGKEHLSWIGPDHNVRSNPAEADAVRARGGAISGGYAFRSLHGDGLQMGRALGDSALGDIISKEPDLDTVQIPDGGFLLIASDGLFDPAHKSFQASAQRVLADIKNNAEAGELVQSAVDLPTNDNVTAILARF